MVKIVVMYPQPSDAATFDAHYFGTHVPLVRKLPGLMRLEAARLRTGPDTVNPIYLLAEMYFMDKDSMKVALRSPEMAACVRDIEQHLPSSNVVYLSDDLHE